MYSYADVEKLLAVHIEDPPVLSLLAELERATRSATLEPELLELVRIRAAQMNGCAYCLVMQTVTPAPAASTRPGWISWPPGGRSPLAPPGSGPRGSGRTAE